MGGYAVVHQLYSWVLASCVQIYWVQFSPVWVNLWWSFYNSGVNGVVYRKILRVKLEKPDVLSGSREAIARLLSRRFPELVDGVLLDENRLPPVESDRGLKSSLENSSALDF